MPIHNLIEFIIKIIQPIISVKPPIGVTGPRNEKLIFVKDCVESRKILNEKRIIPNEKINSKLFLLWIFEFDIIINARP